MYRHPQLKEGKKLGYVIYDRDTMEILTPLSFTPYVYPFDHQVPPRFGNAAAAETTIQRYYSNRTNLGVVAFANYVDHMQKKTGLSITQPLY
jgi:hypothetical protein